MKIYFGLVLGLLTTLYGQTQSIDSLSATQMLRQIWSTFLLAFF